MCRRAPLSASALCGKFSHVCIVDEAHGCSSCGHTCHNDCGSGLCVDEPCAFCLSVDLLTPEGSALCITTQRRDGCHACGRVSCDTSANDCHAQCTALNHVCGPSVSNGGCDNCGRVCHSTNEDIRCVYYTRGRGQLAWTPDAQQMLDTQSGTGGTLPHLSQIAWAFNPQVPGGPRTLVVEGASYRVGRGDPGRDSDGACANNCLIDSLRQCLGLDSDCTLVRRDLIAQYLLICRGPSTRDDEQLLGC